MKKLIPSYTKAIVSVVTLLAFLGGSPAALLAAPSNAASPAIGSSLPATPASAAVGLPHGSTSQSQDIMIVETSGTVERRPAGSQDWIPVQKGDKCSTSDVIRTGSDGAARIEFDGKIRMQILSDSEMTIEEARRENDKTRQTLLTLNIGKIKADVDKLADGSTFKVKTPTAVAAVRGTTLYLSVVRFAQGLNGILTNLYVDKGKVDFGGLNDAINHLMVEAFHTSSVDGSGEASEARELKPEEREALIGEFEKALGGGGNPQTGVESGVLPGGPANGLGQGGDDAAQREAIEKLIDALLETRNENAGVEDETPVGDNLLQTLKDQAELLSSGPKLSGNFEYDKVSSKDGREQGIVTDERTALLDDALAANNPAQVLERIADLQDLRDQEKQDLRDSLASILNNQDFLNEIAAEDKRVDAQTGKVFTDVHGNRVRTDQYVYHEDGSDTVRFVSMTLRTGEYQPGISSMELGVQFNSGLSEGTILRDLPWSDYLNVVTEDEFNNRTVNGIGSAVYLDQFIVHDKSGAEGPDLYPVHFYAEFKNPDADSVRFSENYSQPVSGDFYTDDTHLTQTERWYQGRTMELTEISSEILGGQLTYGHEVVDNGNFSSVETIGDVSVIDSGEGAQSGDLRGAGQLTGALDTPEAVDVFKNLPINNDGDSGNDLHPAYFSDTLDADGSVFRLTGYFIPIDNLGQIINETGFRVQSLRDLVNPNSLVAGGKYNLETIFMFAEDDGEGGYNELFRIDTIITPEIFEPYGLLSSTSGSLFPDRLVPDDDDVQRQLD